MRSEIAKRILEETPEDVKKQIKNYSKSIVMNKLENVKTVDDITNHIEGLVNDLLGVEMNAGIDNEVKQGYQSILDLVVHCSALSAKQAVIKQTEGLKERLSLLNSEHDRKESQVKDASNMPLRAQYYKGMQEQLSNEIVFIEGVLQPNY